MRDVYQTDAVYRDDKEPHAPRERPREATPQAMRSVPSGLLSRWVVPARLRYWAIGVSVSAPDRSFAQGDAVPFEVRLRNRLPIPITLPVESPVPWTWSVDGVRSAERAGGRSLPSERRGYQFDRGESKAFTRRWSGSFRIGAREWERAEPGEHTIRIALAVADPEANGLVAETTVHVGE